MKMKHSWGRLFTKGLETQKQREDLFKREFVNATNDNLTRDQVSKKPKRYRSAFTTEQVTYLEKEFQKYPYIGNSRRRDVASALEIPERAVKIWFQNRRMKEKKDAHGKDSVDVKDANDQLQKTQTQALKLTNDMILPLLTENENSVVIKTETTNSPNSGTCRYYNGSPPNQDMRVTSNTTTVIKGPISSNLSTELSINLVKKNITESSNESYKEKLPGYVAETIVNQAKCSSTLNQMPSSENQTSRLAAYLQGFSAPQDLSSYKKPVLHCQPTMHKPKESVQYKSSGTIGSDLPLYMRSYYAQTYMPPGIWKPINVAPLIPAEVKGTQIDGNNQGFLHVSQEQTVPKRACHCNCHTQSYSPPIMMQNNLNPQMQYVLTAMPYQNHSVKF